MVMKDLHEKVEKIKATHFDSNYGYSDYTLDVLLSYIEELEKENKEKDEKISELLRKVFD